MRFTVLFLAIMLGGCRATLRPDFVKVVALLGEARGMDAGDCTKPDALKAAYESEVGKPGVTLADALLPFAQKAAEVCPGSRPSCGRRRTWSCRPWRR